MARTTRKTTRSNRIVPIALERVSKMGERKEDDVDFRALAEQRETIEHVRSMFGLPPIDEHFVELNVSGGKGADQRPQLDAALSRIEDPNDPANALIVARLTRLARSIAHTREAVDRIVAAGGTFYSPDLGMAINAETVNTIGGKTVLTMLSLAAEIELDRYRDGYEAGRATATAEGIKVSRTPKGYERVVTRQLVPHEVEGPAVTVMFQMRASGESWSALRTRWHELTGEWLGTTTFAAMIRNRTYLGEVRNGDEHVKTGVHDALTTPDVFELAQTGGEGGRRRGVKGEPSLLAGIATCASCGGKLTTTTTTGRKGQKVRRYVCARANRTGVSCERGVTIQMERLDAHVEAAFVEWSKTTRDLVSVADDDDEQLAEFDRIEAALLARRSETEAAFADLDADVDSLKGAIAAVSVKLDAVRDERDEFLATRRVAGVRLSAREQYEQLRAAGDVRAMRTMLDAAIESLVIRPSSANGEAAKTHLPIEARVVLRFARD